MRHLYVIGVSALALGLIACGRGAEVQLYPATSTPGNTSPPSEAPSTKDPATEKPSLDPGSGDPVSGGSDPSVPSAPSATSLTLLCEQPLPGRLGLLPVLATDDDIPTEFKLANSATTEASASAATDPEHVQDVRFPLPLGLNARGELDVLMSARDKIGLLDPGIQAKIYVASLDLPYRRGRLQEVGAPARPLRAAEDMARLAGVRPRTFGMSRNGELLFVPSARGYTILRRTTPRSTSWKTVGEIPVSAETHFDPTAETGDVVTFWQFDAEDARFKMRAFSLNRVSNTRIDARAIATPGAASGYSQLGAVAWGTSRVAWLETAMGTRGPVAERARLVIWDVTKKTHEAIPLAFTGISPSTLLFGRPARLMQSNEARIVVGLENIEPTVGTGARAALVILRTGGRGAVETARIPYPTEVLKRIGDFRDGPRMSALITDSSGDFRTRQQDSQVFVTLPGRWGIQTHRLVMNASGSSGWMEPITLFACENPSLTRDVR